jgi:hypothetical protein
MQNKGELRELMATILFIYGKEHSDIMYRQGMHEILGAILVMWIGILFKIIKHFRTTNITKM